MTERAEPLPHIKAAEPPNSEHHLSRVEPEVLFSVLISVVSRLKTMRDLATFLNIGTAENKPQAHLENNLQTPIADSR